MAKGNKGQLWAVVDEHDTHGWLDPVQVPEIRRLQIASGRATAELAGINEHIQQTLKSLNEETTPDIVKNMQVLFDRVELLNTAVNKIAKTLQERGLL